MESWYVKPIHNYKLNGLPKVFLCPLNSLMIMLLFYCMYKFKISHDTYLKLEIFWRYICGLVKFGIYSTCREALFTLRITKCIKFSKPFRKNVQRLLLMYVNTYIHRYIMFVITHAMCKILWSNYVNQLWIILIDSRCVYICMYIKNRSTRSRTKKY
jgi:hypothetical protein